MAAQGGQVALLTQPLYLQFAGQATSYFEELKELAAHPSAAPLIQTAGIELAKVGCDERFGLELSQGLDVAAWLGMPSSISAPVAATPDAEYLSCAAVAYPLITLTQLARLLATSHAIGLQSPTDLRFLGAFGHSSGILSCAIAAVAQSLEEYQKLSVEAVVLAAHHGLRCQQHCPVVRPSIHVWKPQYVRQRPTPMLHVEHKGILSRQEHLNKLIHQFNHHNQNKARQIHIGLKNGPASVVVGAPESLHWLFETLSASLEKDQSRVPFSERKPELFPQFLDVTVPFHSPRLAGVDEQIHADVAACPGLAQLRQLAAERKPLRFPVYSTEDGKALRSFDLEKLIAMQTSAPLDWGLATQALASQPGYVLDMGPSLSTARLTRFLHGGNGAVVANPTMTTATAAAKNGIAGLALLLEQRSSRLPPLASWAHRFSPRFDAVGNIVTKFTRLVGRPPVMVPGMTPWSHAEQVAAAERAGYHAELAGGGIPLPGHFTKEVRKLALSIPPGAGITVNLLYLNAYLWGFQFPLVEKLALQGEPLESITVAAGIPSLEKLRDIVESAKRARLNFITFKPGSASAINAVLEVCSHFPSFQFVIQWTGGRSGGHHSFEDQYEPLLETYALIRNAENITLVVGGGLGTGADAYEWLSGDWSLRFGRPHMPVDGVLMGSRVLATAESATGDMTKDLLLAAKGVEEKDWELSFQRNTDAGGVITVQSELGEPIHVVKNRCSVIWRDFDDRYFSLPREKMLEALMRDKAEVIRRLNVDFQKPWFASVGGKPCDLGEMTYYDVCIRMVDLMFLAERGEWIDPTYRLRLGEMLARTEERFVHAKGSTKSVASLVDEAELNLRPLDTLSRVFERYPWGRVARLLIEDQDYFVHSVCNPVDRKPVNFIPQLDVNFKRYFKSDSLWFSEALHAVPERDAGRTFIIYGPVAAQSVHKKDETLAEVLNGVCTGIKECLAKQLLPDVKPFQDPDALQDVAMHSGVSVDFVEGETPAIAISLGPSGCPVEIYRKLLTELDVAASTVSKKLMPGEGMSWVKALYHGLLVRGDRRAPSPVTRLLQPLPNMQVVISSDGQCICIRHHDSSGAAVTDEPGVRLAFKPDGSTDAGGCVTVTVWHARTAIGAVPLELQYLYRPSTPSCPLHEPAKMRYSSSTAFYVRVWEEPSGNALRESASWVSTSSPASWVSISSSDASPQDGSSSSGQPGRPLGTIPVSSVHALDQFGDVGVPGLSGGAATEGTVYKLTKTKLVDFCLAVGLTFPCYVAHEHPKVPMDFAIVAGWTGLIAAVLRDRRVGPIDWLTLLHLENRFEELQVRHMKGTEDTFTSSFELIEVTTTPGGKSIGVRGLVKHCGAPWVVVTTYFFVPTDIAAKEEEEEPIHFKIANRRCLIHCDEGMSKVIASKKFFQLSQPLPLCDIVVEVHSKDTRSGAGPFSIEAHGTLSKRCEGQDVPIGKVAYKTEASGNALLAFLDRHAADHPMYCALDSPYFVLEAPDVTRSPLSMQRYSRSSGDWNPIHTDMTFAHLAALSGPIVHGMWLSANARRVLAEHLGEQDAREVTSFKTQFVDKVPVGSHIVTQVKHVGMRGGQRVVEVESRKLEDGQICLQGTADIRQGKTLLTFTGQGSQFAGMGRDLRQTSDVAKQLWERAEKHFMSKYGVSLLQIVDENPQEKLVHFGGAEGARIRDVYRNYTRRTPEGKDVPVFPSVSPESETYMFSHKTGLLNATQFTQPLLILTEMAQFLTLKEKQLIPEDSLFAGHSLGEYAALFSVAGLMSLENLLDVVFMRGLTMQAAVDRHEDGSSDYGMVAVNPSRVGKHFTVQDLMQTVDLLDDPGELLQIVNYNVEPRQYVCAGHVRALKALRLVLDEIAATGCSIQAAVEKHKTAAQYTSFADLKGKATIPLEGIDVPFHSRQLRSGVVAFRMVLESSIPSPLEGYKSLEHRYIPNLLGEPFSLSKAYIEMAAERTSSPVLASILENWTEAAMDEAALARTLLVELLSYQFASPVLWSQTVEEAICRRGVGRFVEFGPGPVLKRMLKTALEATPALVGQRAIENLNFADSTELTFAYADRGPSTEDLIANMKESEADGSAEPRAVEVSIPPPTAAVVPVPMPVAPQEPKVAPAAASGPDADVPVRAIDVLRLIVGSRVGEVAPGKTLKQLVGGRSALQNELIGEVTTEFGSDPPENPAELPLEELAQHWPAFSKLGRASTQLVSKVLLQTMPAGTSMNTAKRQLEEEFAITAATAESILLRAVPLAPSKRLSAAEAVVWRASLVSRFNSEMGVEVLPRKAGSSTGGPASTESSTAAMDPKTAEKLRNFARTIGKAANDFLGPAPKPPQQEFTVPLPLEAEVGSKFAEGVQPMFSKAQVREYNDWWAIGQRRVRAAWQRCEAGQLDLSSETGHRTVRLAALSSSEATMHLLSWLSLHSKEKGCGRAFCEQVQAQAGQPPLFFEDGGTFRPTVTVDDSGTIIYEDVPRHKSMIEHVAELAAESFVSLRTRAEKRDESIKGVSRMVDDAETSSKYLAALLDVAKTGISFRGKVAFLTGLSPGSLTEPLAKMLLQGGATVFSTMWWLRGDAPYDYFRSLYAENCAEGARLIVAPFNQACNQDVAALVQHIYGAEKDGGLGLDVDFFVPFAALPEKGHGIGDIDGFSELAHRVMLTNTIRMTGEILKCKRERRIQGKTTLCIMPLSPNHGVFGYDGLYAESKLGLESFFEKWHSEGLKDYLSIVGATMGWVRGTNLMMANNIVAPAMEERGCHTFTAAEMAFNLVGLMHPDMVREAQSRPIHALLTGKMERMDDLAGTTARARVALNARSEEVKLVKSDLEADDLVESGGSVIAARRAQQARLVHPRPYASYPARHGAAPPSAEQRGALAELKGMVDPASTVVITGFGEVGPWGDAWTRWEMERDGEFSIEGCVLLAWMLGFIKYFNGPVAAAKGPPVHYSGWVDASSSKPVSYWDVKELYEEKILNCCGMRLLDPAVLDGYDGTNTMMHHTVLLEEDLAPVEVDDGDVAQEFLRQHGDLCEVSESTEGTWTVRMRKGAKIFVPRALRSDRWICAQVPSHWNPRHFGIPEDIISQVDKVTLYALVGCAQALRESGIMDPYEFYEYVHLSQVGNSLGSGIGGLSSLKEMFTHRYHSDAKRVKGDVLQETFINTTAAWLNMLMLSSSGPIKTPVGACATAMESAAIAVDTILNGQAKVMLVGGVDDLNENSSREFASMKATASADADKLAGRRPSELSRPMSLTRSGFVESHGSGVMVFMSGDLALAMGAPIHAVVGCVHTATDHTGRSVPAPGQGVLSAVSEAGPPSPLLDLKHRRQLLESELAQLRAAVTTGTLPQAELPRLEGLARRRWSLDWWQNNASVSRLRGSLSVFGLTADDITLCSCHGTSTKLNDKNEASILQQEMDMLGRTPGNPLYIITQKWLTGHPKGPAAAWQMHGVMQAMGERAIPGNRNLDCVDPALRSFPALFFPRDKVESQFVSAALVNSFGFGQAGGQCLLIHPNYFLAAVQDDTFDAYLRLLEARQAQVFKHRQDIFGGRAPFVPIKSEDPFSVPFSTAILDKSFRSAASGLHSRLPQDAARLAKGATGKAPSSLPSLATQEEARGSGAVARALAQAAAGIAGPALSMGIDAEPVGVFQTSFLDRNFSKEERADIVEHDLATGTQRSAAGLWAAKEAVVKALGNAGAVLRGADEPLLDVGLHRLHGGSLRVELEGRARDAAEQLGVREARVSLTYADGVAFAAAILV